MRVKELIDVLYSIDGNATVKVRCCPNGTEKDKIETSAIYVESLERFALGGEVESETCCIISG